MQNYTELELVGKGSYGKVYKVKSHIDQQNYVLKKVAFDGSAQNEAEASLREAQVLSSLRHPHIVPYKEFFKHDDGDLCLVMAFCEGGDLFHYIKQLRRSGTIMDENLAWQWLVQLLLALSYCHSKKILHRDVKSQNIFISEGKVLLGDFGLAKQLQRTIEMARTPIGTPYYMAPEIYEEQPYSYKSDVWALGCVMYEMLTGRPAFAADNLSRVVIRVIRGNYDPIPSHFSEEIREVVGCMLCKTVKNRPEVNELLQHPSVVKHVQQYLDSLSAAGPAGWSTWRMKLPPSMLAQLAAVVAKSRATSNPGAPPGAGGIPAVPPSAPVLSNLAPHAMHLDHPPRNLLPQQLEDALSESALIDGFSLQSLLKDLPANAQQAKEEVQAVQGGGDSMVLGSMDQQQMHHVVAGLAANQRPGTAGPPLELLLLTHQIISMAPQVSGTGGWPSPAESVPQWCIGPLSTIPDDQDEMMLTGGSSVRTRAGGPGMSDASRPGTAMSNATRPSTAMTELSRDVAWLANGLPQAGYGFQIASGGAGDAGVGAGRHVYRRYTSGSSTTSTPGVGSEDGAGLAPAAMLVKPPPLAQIQEEPSSLSSSTGVRNTSSGGGASPSGSRVATPGRPGRLPPISSAPPPAHTTPAPAGGWGASLGKSNLGSAEQLLNSSLASMLAPSERTPMAPAAAPAPAEFGPSRAVLASRAVGLRRQLEAQLGGASQLADALHAVRGAQAHLDVPAGSGVWTGAALAASLDEWADPDHGVHSMLVQELHYILYGSQDIGMDDVDDEQVSDLLPLLDELLFLEAQQGL